MKTVISVTLKLFFPMVLAGLFLAAASAAEEQAYSFPYKGYPYEGYYCFSGADFNGDVKGEPAIYRPSTGRWSILGVTSFYYGGRPGDVPVVWVSPFTGKASPGIFRDGRWHWKYDFNFYFDFGQAGDIPVPANYDGPLHDNMAIFRPVNGLWKVYAITQFYFGQAGDLPVPGHWLEDAKSCAAIFRPSTGLWVIRGDGASLRFRFGKYGDIPVPGQYKDGIWSAAIFRPSTGMWAIRNVTRIYFGSSSDRPMAADLGISSFLTYMFDEDPVVFRASQSLWRIKGAFYGGGNRRWFGTEGDIPVCGPHL